MIQAETKRIIAEQERRGLLPVPIVRFRDIDEERIEFVKLQQNKENREGEQSMSKNMDYRWGGILQVQPFFDGA